MSTIVEYLKTLKWYLTVGFVVFYILSNTSALGSSIYLSDWSNNAEQENDKPYLRNRRLIVYIALTLGQCIIVFKLLLLFLNMLL